MLPGPGEYDRDLIASFANRLLVFTDGGLVDFRGTYEEFLAQEVATKKPPKKKR